MSQLVYTRRVTVFLLLPLLISLACNALPSASPPGTASPPGSSPTAPAVSTPAPASEPTEVPTGLPLPQEIALGPGPFILTDTLAGLSTLASYKATLTHSFEGTHEGTAVNWSSTYTMLATSEPLARQWTLETSGHVEDPGPLFMALTEGVEYKRQGEAPCTANVVEEGDAAAGPVELASFLTGVIGADEAGSVTVNDIASDHYTFDQRALLEEGVSQSTGELWVAAEGGYIVKYLLTSQAGADHFGDGLEGMLTVNYELSGINQLVAIVLPEDCPAGQVDAPMLPDAVEVVQVPGLLAYGTSTSLAEATAFYQEQLPGLGWAPQGEPATAESITNLGYTQGEQQMSVILTVEGDQTAVTITVGPAPAEFEFVCPPEWDPAQCVAP
jgi:hypothetical protein